MLGFARAPIKAYVVGLLTPPLATWAILALPVGSPGRAQYDYLYLAMVALVALAAGGGPAIVSAVLSVLMIDWFFLPPAGLAVEGSDGVADLALFMVVALIVAALADARRRQGRHLSDLAKSLLRSNIELERRRQDAEAGRRAAVEQADRLTGELEELRRQVDTRS